MFYSQTYIIVMQPICKTKKKYELTLLLLLVRTNLSLNTVTFFGICSL